MGMTDDLEAAVAEGATHVRVGTAIFGPRKPRVIEFGRLRKTQPLLYQHQIMSNHISVSSVAAIWREVSSGVSLTMA